MASADRPDRATDSPGYLLKRAEAALSAVLAAALREQGSTLAQHAVLTILDEEPGLSNADLARRAFVTPQAMNEVLRELEQKGWVTRRPHPAHGRIRQASLTPAGRAALVPGDRTAAAVEDQMLAALSSADRRRFAAALRACIGALSQPPRANLPRSASNVTPEVSQEPEEPASWAR